MAQTYWQTRARQNEAKAMRLAATYSKRQKRLFNDAYKAIEVDLNDLLLDIAVGSTPTRTELWRAAKYMRLKQTIEEQANILADKQVGLLDELLQTVFADTIQSELGEVIGKSQRFNVLSNSLLQKAINTAWSGKNYSDRVWTNRDALARKLDKNIADMIVLGKSPDDIKKQLSADFDVAYNVADRLIRTEASHTYNSAAIDAYKAAGIKQVKYLHGGRCSNKCDCHSLDGKIFDIGTEPILPRHPNCICCYAPVVDLTLQENNGTIEWEQKELDAISASFPKYGKAISPKDAKKVKITHGGTHADKKLFKRGITIEDAQHYEDTAIIAFQQSTDKTMHLSRDGVAIVLDNGGLSTAYPKSWFDDEVMKLLKEVERICEK